MAPKKGCKGAAKKGGEKEEKAPKVRQTHQPEIRLPSIAPKLHLPVATLLPRQLFAVHGFLYPSEAQAIVSSLEAAGLAPTPPPPPSQVSEYAVRKMKRTAFDSSDYSEALWSRTGMKELLDSTDFGVEEGWELAGLNSNIRGYRYDVGDRFGRHYDGAYHLPDGADGRRRRTEYTLLLYLGDEKLEGGETVFWLPGSGPSGSSRGGKAQSGAGKKRGRKGKQDGPSGGNEDDGWGTDVPVDGMQEVVVPATRGTLLLHRHGDACLLHEGNQVTASCKYVLRSDLVFRGPPS